MADSGEPDGAAEVVIGVVAAGLGPFLGFLPFRVHVFGGLIDEEVGAEGADGALEFGDVVHGQLGVADGEHGTGGGFGTVLTHGGDDDGELWFGEVAAEVADEVLEVGGVFVFCAVLVVPALEPDEASYLEGTVFEGWEGGAGGGAGVADFVEHFPIGCAVFLLDVFEDGEGIVAGVLFVFLGDPIAGLLEFFGNEVCGEAGGGRAELFEE